MKNVKVGFVGLGTMGAPMAANIAKSGFSLKLYDVNQETAKTVGEHIGATVISDVASLTDCQYVIFMLPNSKIVQSILFDDESLRVAFDSDTILIDMSSSDPIDTVQTGKQLAAHGIRLVDAPVSGARERAAEGTLSIMLGAEDDSTANDVVPVLESMSREIYRTGKLGTGHAMKALNNFVAAASFVASSEALIAGERFGLNPKVMVDIFNASTGQSFVTTHVLPKHVVGSEFASGFSLPLMTKDVKIATALKRGLGQVAPVSEAVSGALTDALDSLGDVDHTRAYEFWETKK